MDKAGLVAVLCAVAKRGCVALVVFAGLMGLGAAFVLVHRHEQVRHGAIDAPSPEPSLLAEAYGDESLKTGRFTSNITYTDLAAPGNTEVSGDVLWDDKWFFADPDAYNHELAYASLVLATLAYSESGHYQQGSKKPAYMEMALHALGFDAVDTSSYRFRSEVIDETLRLVTGKTDAAAYTVARKHIVSDAGERRTLLMVSVRGSYGSEWLSNFKLALDGARADEDERQNKKDGAAAQKRSAGKSDAAKEDDSLYNQPSYQQAANEIKQALRSWYEQARSEGERVELLFVGHSRGGAVANLLAADALKAPQAQSGEMAVRAYTFATPATTLNRDAHDASYGSIFNISNPSDLMPALPLASWGYRRYGVDLEFCPYGAKGFEAARAQMQRAFERRMGVPDPSHSEDAELLGEVLGDIAQNVTSAHDLFTPGGMAAVVSACALRVDPVQVLYSHYPSVYLAWMEAAPPQPVEDEGNSR